MFWIEIILFSIVLINSFETTFVSVGNYSKHSDYGINSPDCGLRLVPKVYEIEFNDNCFDKKYPNITYRQFIEENDKTFTELINSRIMMGTDVQFAEAPWAVLLSDKHGLLKGKYCSGVLITFEWVLTAGHCEKWISFTTLKVYAGSNIRNKGDYIEVNEDKWFRHPNFEDKTYPLTFRTSYDLALIKLLKKFTQSKDGQVFTINTICLPQSGQYNSRSGERATFFGWGWKSSSSETNELRKAEFVLEPTINCLENVTLCTKYDDKYNGPRACKGDSGGGLVQWAKDRDNTTRAVLIGTTIGVSPDKDNNWWASDCSKEKIHDNIWTNIADKETIDWILKTTQQN